MSNAQLLDMSQISDKYMVENKINKIRVEGTHHMDERSVLGRIGLGDGAGRSEDHKVVDPKSYAAVRLIPLSEQSRQIIQAALKYKQESGATGPWIFSEYERPLPSRIVEKYYQKYGVQKEIRRGDKIIHKGKSTHNARKTCISSMIDSNMNINTVRKIVGHTDERTTLKHYVFDRSTPDEQRLQFENATKYECNHL